MLTPEIIANNKKSWSDLLLDIDENPDNDAWREWNAFMRSLIRAGIDADWDQYFRAGRAMNDIIFSTREKHRLERNDPYVTVAKTNGQFFVSWSHHIRCLPETEPEQVDIVTPADALPTLRRYLVQLWKETRPDEETPRLDSKGDAPRFSEGPD
jgi:hypothetical protein